MWLRRELRFWSRLVHYYASRARFGHALGGASINRRLLGQVGLVAFLAVAGYVLGRVSAPGCEPVAGICTEAAQASASPVPTVAEPQSQTNVVLASVAGFPPKRLPEAATATPPLLGVNAVPSPEAKKPAERAAALSNDEIREMQAWLKAFGFDPGPIDGYPGARTSAAVKRYQAARQTEETGVVDRSLLRKVRREAGHS